jgi:hypothetical protein
MPSLAELTSKQLLTRRQYISALIRGVVYIIVWVGILVLGMYFWHVLRWYYKALIFIIVFLLVPSLEDIKDSFKSYEHYKKEWEEANKDKNEKEVGDA